MENFNGKSKVQKCIGAWCLHFEENSDDYSKKTPKNLLKQSVLPLFLYFFQWDAPLLHNNTLLKEKEKVKTTPMTFAVPYQKMDSVWPKFKQLIPSGNKLLDTLNKPNQSGWSHRNKQGGWKLHPRKETPAGMEGRHTPRTELTLGGERAPHCWSSVGREEGGMTHTLRVHKFEIEVQLATARWLKSRRCPLKVKHTEKNWESFQSWSMAFSTRLTSVTNCSLFLHQIP